MHCLGFFYGMEPRRLVAALFRYLCFRAMAFPQKKKPGFGGNKEWKTSQPKEPKEVTEAMALTRLLRFCAYQERSEAEVRQKMRIWALPAPTEAKLIERLTEDNYLNEARFVAAFAGGKHRNQG